MKACRCVCLVLLLSAAASVVQADERQKKGVTISDEDFRQISSMLLNDPHNRAARDWARLTLLYTLQTDTAAFVLGSEELRWVDLDKADEHTLLLLAGYAAGNIQSQLNSGVKRNDCYSGVLTLFRVYRTLRERNRRFRVAAVDELLKLHQQDKLVPYLRKLEVDLPSKLRPADEAAIRKLMKR